MEKFKKLSLVLALAIVLQILMPVNYAFAEEFGEERIKEASLEVRINGEGPGAGGNFTDIPNDADISIGFRFDFKAEVDPENPETTDYYYYDAGDYFEFDLPKEIQFSGQPAEGWPLNDDDGEIYARVTVTESTDKSVARLTFVKEVPNDNLFAQFTLDGKFVNIDEDDGTIVTIDIGYGADEIRIGVNPPVVEPVSIDLNKTSELDLENNKIKWTLIVSPDQGKEAKDVIITDYFNTSENQVFAADSFKVENSGQEDVTDLDGFALSADKFVYTFPGPISEPHTITYETDISASLFSESSTTKTIKYVNEAEGTAKDFGPVRKSDEQSINWIAKSGEAQTGDNLGRIKWTVIIRNEDGFLKGKTGVQIVDTITGNHEFDDSYPVQIKLNNDSIRTAGKGTDTGYGAYNTSGKTLTYTFNPTHINTNFTSAVLTYYTKITDGGDSNAQGTYGNSAKLIIPGVSNNPSDGSSIGIGNGIIQKSVGGTHDYAEGLKIDWTIYLNKNNQSGISNVTIVDTIPNGLKYVEGSFKYDGNSAVPQVDENEDGTARLSYLISGSITGLKKITYQTEVKADYPGLITNDSVSFENGAKLTGTGITGTPGHKVSTSVKNTVITKTVDSDYNYDTRKLSWKITINENKLPLEGVVVTDIIPEGMVFLRDSFEFDGNPLQEADETKLREGTANEGKNTTFIFELGDTSASHTITFETMVTEEYLLENLNKKNGLTFNNISELTSGGKEATANAGETIENDLVRKEGVRTGFDLVKWYVPININKIDLGPIELSDEFQSELSLDLDSVRLYELNAGDDGNYKDGDGYLYTLPKANLASDTDKYEISYVNNVFTFKFKEEVGKTAYVLEFTTFVNATKPVVIRNEIKLEGITVLNNPSNNIGTIDVNSWSGSAGSTPASLTIYKVDENDEALEGAVFELSNSRGSTFLPATPEEGTYVYEPLNLSRYFIKEITAPAGYLKYDHNAAGEDSRGIQISVNHSAGIEYYFKNKKAEAEVVLIKKSTTGMKLSGAEFTLYEEDGETIFEDRQPVMSDNEGRVVFSGIPVGNYIIKETKIPEGYIALGDGLSVSVGINDDNTAMMVVIDNEEANEDYTVYNRLVTDKVMVIKADTSRAGLDGAEFGIYDKDNEIIDRAYSGENGIVQFDNIAEGEYAIKEITAPDGYIKSDAVIYVSVVENNEELEIKYGTSEGLYDLETAPEFENKSIDIEFIKQNKNKRPLKGAEFTLYEEDGETVFESRKPVRSGDEGKVLFTIIPEGTYVIKETRAPSGYRQLRKDILVVVELDADGQPVITFSYSDQSEVLRGDNDELIVINERRPSGGGIEPEPEPEPTEPDPAEPEPTGPVEVPGDTEIEDPNMPEGWDELDDPNVPADTTAPPSLPDTGNILNSWMLAVIGFIFILTGIVLFNRRSIRN